MESQTFWGDKNTNPASLSGKAQEQRNTAPYKNIRRIQLEFMEKRKKKKKNSTRILINYFNWVYTHMSV